MEVLPWRLAVCRLSPDEPFPAWALAGEFHSLTCTADELSVVCPQDLVPLEIRCERGWKCLRVAGPLDLTEIGVLASLSSALAGAGVSLFAISTFDTDFLLVGEADLERAVAALRVAGHQVETDP